MAASPLQIMGRCWSRRAWPLGVPHLWAQWFGADHSAAAACCPPGHGHSSPSPGFCLSNTTTSQLDCRIQLPRGESLAPPSLTLARWRTECLSLGLPPAGQESWDTGSPRTAEPWPWGAWGVPGQESPWTGGAPGQAEPRDTGSPCFPCLQRASVDFEE